MIGIQLREQANQQLGSSLGKDGESNEELIGSRLGLYNASNTVCSNKCDKATTFDGLSMRETPPILKNRSFRRQIILDDHKVE